MERSLALIKPDAVERNLIGDVISRYESNGLKVVALKMMQVTRELASKHYACHKGKDFYEELIEFITRSPLVAIILEGQDTVNTVRRINGITDPKAAAEGTIRRAYGHSKTENCVHSSDSPENAKQEIELWFPELSK